MLKDVMAKRFVELQSQSNSLPFRSNSGGMSGAHVLEGAWQQWATSAQSLIRAACGEHSPHYTNFVTAFKECSGYDYHVKVLQGIFQSAREDFEGGYIFDVDLRVSGEVFGDFVAMAKQALSDGYKDVAAVLACAALEDALKRFAQAKGLSVDDSTMSEVVNALKSKGLVSGAQKSLLDTMPKIRNFAMHGNWDKISAADAGSVIGFVEQFLLSNFGNG